MAVKNTITTMVIINGEQVDEAGGTLAGYLAKNGLDKGRVAVEINGDIVPKAKYADTVLKDGDKVEIVRFVGGG
ncbi:MAG: sulfur carrier protein ThiS [Victivallales bacterium]|nr:sulfur carrier protein ThiS [Victivallales bacterium]